MVSEGAAIGIGIILFYLFAYYLMGKTSHLPIDNKRRPFSFDEKVKVIEKNVQRYGIARCTICSETRDFEIDHIKPLDKGGHNGPDNLQLLCKKHNRKKATKY